MTVTNQGIRRRCRVHLKYDCEGNVMPVPHAFDDLVRPCLDAKEVWFTTIVLSPDMFEEYIAVVDGNIAAQKERDQENWRVHNERKELVKARGATQCGFPTQMLFSLADMPSGTTMDDVFTYVLNELSLDGLRNGFDLVRYESDSIVLVRLPNLNGSTMPLDEGLSAAAQKWYNDNKAYIHLEVLSNIRTRNRERKEQNKVNRWSVPDTLVKSRSGGAGKGSHRGKVCRESGEKDDRCLGTGCSNNNNNEDNEDNEDNTE